MEVSIVTCSYNRHDFLEHMKSIVAKQDYPHSKMEWIIMDDSATSADNMRQCNVLDGITVKYIHLAAKIPLAKKRDYLNHLASGRYIVNMDDDDYYPPDRVSRAVAALKSGASIVGSSQMYMFFTIDSRIYQVGPYGENHSTAAPMAYTKEYSNNHSFYNPTSHGAGDYAEESQFTNGWRQQLVQLDPRHTILAVSHSDNTVDKTIFLEKKYGQMGVTVHQTNLTLNDFIQDPAIRSFYEKLSYVKKEQNAIGKEIETKLMTKVNSVAERYRQTMTNKMKIDIKNAKVHLDRLKLYDDRYLDT